MKKRRGKSFYPRIRTRHPSHDIFRRNKDIRQPFRSFIRLGSTTPTDEGIEIELNSVESIKICSDKLKMKKAFDEAKISHVEWSENAEDIKLPLVIKSRYGSRNKGNTLILTEEALKEELAKRPRGSYIVEKFFNSAREYRFHVCTYGCVYSCRKLRREQEKERWYFNNQNCVWVCKNTPQFDDNGEFTGFGDYNPKYNTPETEKQIIDDCLKYLKHIGMDFAAFDVRVKKDGSYAIIEANSAPSLAQVGQVIYKEMFNKLLKQKHDY